MNIKPYLLLIPSLALATFAADSPSVLPAARYQLLSGSYLDIDQRHTPATIKIDTITGQTWLLRELPAIMKDKRRVNVIGWAPIYDDVAEAVESIQRSVPIPNPNPQSP